MLDLIRKQQPEFENIASEVHYVAVPEVGGLFLKK